jgi:DNA-binding GntR family transcriptional regulator
LLDRKNTIYYAQYIMHNQELKIGLPNNFHPGTKTEYVVEAIRNALLLGEIKPGTRITEREIRTSLGVSSTPVREAFYRLEAEGLLTKDPHHGTSVTSLEVGDLKELYTIQSYLQEVAVRLCAEKLKPESIEEAEKLNNDMMRMSKKDLDIKGLRIANYKLHMTLCGAQVFPWLTRVISGLWVLFPTQTLWSIPGRAELSIQQHEKIINAIKKRDSVLAGSLMKEHLESSMNVISDLSDSVDGIISDERENNNTIIEG